MLLVRSCLGIVSSRRGEDSDNNNTPLTVTDALEMTESYMRCCQIEIAQRESMCKKLNLSASKCIANEQKETARTYLTQVAGLEKEVLDFRKRFNNAEKLQRTLREAENARETGVYFLKTSQTLRQALENIPDVEQIVDDIRDMTSDLREYERVMNEPIEEEEGQQQEATDPDLEEFVVVATSSSSVNITTNTRVALPI